MSFLNVDTMDSTSGTTVKTWKDFKNLDVAVRNDIRSFGSRQRGERLVAPLDDIEWIYSSRDVREQQHGISRVMVQARVRERGRYLDVQISRYSRDIIANARRYARVSILIIIIIIIIIKRTRAIYHYSRDY